MPEFLNLRVCLNFIACPHFFHHNTSFPNFSLCPVSLSDLIGDHLWV